MVRDYTPGLMTIRHRVLGVLFMAAAAGISLLAGAQGKVAVQRTVYVVATDSAGAHVTDLAPTDLKVQDGGRERAILRVEPSRSRLKVAFVIDELLSADVSIRVAAFQSIQRIAASGDVALFLVGRRNEKLVDYNTSDMLVFRDAINGFPIRPQYPGNLVESLFEIIKEQHALEGRRVVVVLAPEIPQQSSVTANGVLDQLRDNGVALYAVTITVSSRGGTLVESPATRLEGGDLTSEMERERVLNDGPKQTGGLHLSLLGPEGFGAALDRVTGELLHQYAVTYVIPAGVKSDGRVKIEATRKGLTVRGPNLMPKV